MPDTDTGGPQRVVPCTWREVVLSSWREPPQVVPSNWRATGCFELGSKGDAFHWTGNGGAKVERIDAAQLIAADQTPPPGNDAVKVGINPLQGLDSTELGMFDIAVAPLNASDTLISVQFIVQYEGQGPQDFTAFIFFPTRGAGQMFAANPLYCGADAIEQNRAGKALTVMVVGGVNASTDPFFVTQTFTDNLWPPS